MSKIASDARSNSTASEDESNTKAKPLTLHPLKLEEALRAILKVKPKKK